MAGKSVNPHKPQRKYFFLDEKLHELLHVNRAQDLCRAWDFEEHNRKVYLWSDVQRKRKAAYTVAEVAHMLGRHRDRIWHYIKEGCIEGPHPAYNPRRESRKTIRNFYSEDEVLDIQEFFAEVHRGRPRKDGYVTNNIPTREEMRGLVQNKRVLYIKDDEGEFIPIWLEKEV